MAAQKPHLKKPVIAAHFEQAKVIRQAYDPNLFYEQRPSWRVALAQVQDPYGWQEISAAGLLHIQAKLAQFESMTWSDILHKRGDGKRPHHFVKLHRICDEARARLEVIFKIVDFDEMISLRLGGTERIWGIAEGSTMRVVFWDPTHDICKSLRD